MAWQSDSTSGYRDLLNKITQFATSQHVSAVAINAAGTGYVANEILTISHAGATLDCTIEVLTVGGSGEILTAKLRNMGAFSNRLASAVVNAGGTGYAVDDVLEVEGGTETQNAKAKVATLTGSAIATVTVQDGGGAYTVAPGLTGAATNNDPGSGSGTGGTLDLTMTGVIGTTGIAATGGSGSSATFNLTLTATGWTAVRDWNNYSYNGLDDEKEVVLEGTVASGDEPFIGFRSYSDEEGVDDRYGLVMCGMTAFSSGDSLAAQMNVGPAVVPSTDDAAHLLCFDASQDIWFSFTPRKVSGVVKTQGMSILAYQPFYSGLLNPFGTATENPYPMFIAGTSSTRNKAPDVGTDYVTSFLECIAPTTLISTPVWFYRLSDTDWIQVVNYNNSSIQRAHTIYPVGKSEPIDGSGEANNIVNAGAFSWYDGICDPEGGVASQLLYPSPDSGDDFFMLVPLTLVRSTTTGPDNSVNDDVHGELDNIFWLSATKTDGSSITVEDTVTVGSDRYTIFASVHNTERYSYFCIKEE